MGGRKEGNTMHFPPFPPFPPFLPSYDDSYERILHEIEMDIRLGELEDQLRLQEVRRRQEEMLRQMQNTPDYSWRMPERERTLGPLVRFCGEYIPLAVYMWIYNDLAPLREQLWKAKEHSRRHPPKLEEPKTSEDVHAEEAEDTD